MIKEIKNKQAYQRNISQDNNNEDQKQHLLVLTYKRSQRRTSGQLNEKTVKYSFTKEYKNKNLLYR